MSSKDPIEEIFRKNQHGLDEQPRDLLWDKIEENLEEKSSKPKKNNWWKYTIAACLVVGLSLASYLFLYESNPLVEQSTETPIVLQPTEITQENASEILDKFEEQKHSVVTTEKPVDAPEIYKEKELTPTIIPAPKAKVYDMTPAAAMVYETPATKETEIETYSAEETKIADESIVFRGNTPTKKEKNIITKKEDGKRMGNMTESSVIYESASKAFNQISIPVKDYLVQYDLISQTDSSVTFQNKNIAYPNEITFKKTNDYFQVIYKGKERRKNSKESKAIQEFIEKNQSDILMNFGLE